MKHCLCYQGQLCKTSGDFTRYLYVSESVTKKSIITHITIFFFFFGNSLNFRRIGQCNRTAGYRRECKFRLPHNRTFQNNKTFKGTKGGRNVAKWAVTCSQLAQQYDRHDYGNGASVSKYPRDLSHWEYGHSECSVRTQHSLYVKAILCFTNKRQ